MREIKFRGRRIDNGEWVYGCLHVIDTKGYGYTGRAIQIQHGTSRPWSVTVDPATVGQFTGLHDRTGKEVYEGDIVEYDHPNVGYGRTDIPDALKMVVPKIPLLYEDSEWDGYISQIKNGEIIGNVHDNPALLEVTP